MAGPTGAKRSKRLPSPTADSLGSESRDSRPKQVRDLLIALFESQGLTPGSRLPSEGQIAELAQVGRSTTREALKLLEQEGLVVVRQGKGRFLSAYGALRVERPITQYESQTDMLAQLGYEFETVTLDVDEDEPTVEEQKALDVGANEAVIRVTRLRSSGGTPLILSICALPRWCIASPIKKVDWNASLNELLAEQGLAPASSMARLQAVRLTTALARKYSLRAADEWLLISETVVTDTGKRIMFAQDYHHAEHFAFNVLRKP